MKTVVRTLTAVVLTALVTTACFAGDDDSADMTSAAAFFDGAEREFADEAPAAPPVETEAPTAGEDAAVGSPEPNAQPVLAVVQAPQRSIVYTANISVEVDDVVAAGEQAQAAVEGLGAVLFGQETTIGEHGRSVLTIKVPPENFREALRRLAGVGTLTSQSVFADDVTERVVDLESRITTAEASVLRLRALLEEAADLQTVAQLESQLLQRETDLEVLRGRLRTLRDQVDLATIVLVLTEPIPPEPEPALELVQTAYAGHDAGDDCPGTEEITIDEGAELTVCYEVTNAGDTPLGDIEVRDDGLDADEDDLVLVAGSLDTPLAPGERVILAFSTVADPHRWPEPQVSATAIDPDGDPLRRRIETHIEPLFLDVIEDDSLPGFADALAAGGRALQRLIGVAVVALGAALPFVWVPFLAAGIVWYRRRRGGDTSGDAAPA